MNSLIFLFLIIFTSQTMSSSQVVLKLKEKNDGKANEIAFANDFVVKVRCLQSHL